MPAERFELPTNGLQNRCSTTELSRHRAGRRLYLPHFAQGSFGGAAAAGGDEVADAVAGGGRTAAGATGAAVGGQACTPTLDPTPSASKSSIGTLEFSVGGVTSTQYIDTGSLRSATSAFSPRCCTCLARFS